MSEESKNFSKPKLMTTKRIETLVDGIFAIAMTLLVLTLDVPALPSNVTDPALQLYLVNLFPKFFVYALSFILLAVFWRIHHTQFHHINKSDSTFIWINVIWLLFVALVPFSTSLIGDYGNLTTAAIFFNVNMFFIGLFSFINWYYAATHGLLSHNLDKREYNRTLRLNLLLPAVAIIAILLSFVSPSWSPIAYLLTSPLKMINNRFS